MPTLEELRNKWFLDFNAPGDPFPPVRRHQGTAVSAYTDGNRVTWLVDGEAYLGEWHDRIVALGAGSELYNSAWRLDAVRPKGETQPPGPDALEVLQQADAAGVAVYVLTCGKLATSRYNYPSQVWLRTNSVLNSFIDIRYPSTGSSHQKFTVFKPPGQAATAILGSLDPAKSRWDRTSHAPDDPQRHPDYREKPTHDLGVLLEGPAVADIELTFRERWQELPSSRINSPVSAPPAVGPHSVQVLHTYGITEAEENYSWSPEGDFTIWASYLNAIRTAATTIYIEDQYLFPFDWPVCFRRSGPARDTDLIYQLGEAIKRGVKVAIVVPFESEDYLGVSQKYQRDLGLHYLAGLAANSPGDLAVAYLHNGTTPVMVHSKVMICDDELVLVGSANFSQRSMTHDSELHIAVVDDDDVFARDLRAMLMSEHLQRPLAELEDQVAAFDRFKGDLNGDPGVPADTRVRRYPTGAPGAVPSRHETYMRSIVDPYAGPDAR